jgi:pSer/pThr/pTyr-binding forkhead associated (FHA) protein
MEATPELLDGAVPDGPGQPERASPLGASPRTAATPVANPQADSRPIVHTTSAASTARSVTRGRLVVIAKSGADGPSYPIGDTLDVGRSEGQIVVSEDPYLSPRHVRLAWAGGKMVLRDLASTNGVYLRLAPSRDLFAGKKAPGGEESPPGEVAVPLEDQDLILVGQQVLRFERANDGDAGCGPATEHGTLLFGSPAAARYARLSQRTVEGITRDVYNIRKAETVLGRESGDVVFTEDPFLSRRHAAIRVLDGQGVPRAAASPKTSARAPSVPPTGPGTGALRFALVDLGSSNGTFLRTRGEVELVSGDHFRVGQQLFRVDLDTEPRPARGDAG